MENQIIQVKQKLSAGYAFLSLGVLISLIVSVTSFFNLAFEILNKKFPDVLNATYQYGYSSFQFESARTFLAMLIIMFPTFLILVYFWKRKEKKGLCEYDEVVRKWLSYIIIFLSVLIVIIDLIVLVRYFVSGEITVRFILKVLITISGAKMILNYFIPEVWNVVFWKINWRKIFKISSRYFSMALVLALIIWSFVVIGSPFKQRQLQLDEKRVQDLSNIQWQVISYWQQKEKLPETINDLKNPLSGYSLPIDPEFEKGKTYEYNLKDNKKLIFELCGTFSLPMLKGWQEYQNYYGGREIMPMMAKNEIGSDVATSAIYPYPSPSGVNDSWDHQIGRTCFERTIDKDLYPPYPKILQNN
ncbi:MAG: DUF5671 domain-containing protein [Candidatus Paceibacterota bacterium]|jgi:hypothetical protein